MKKWRDNKANGRESTKTGNFLLDTSNCKDDEFCLVSDFMSQKAGCGVDLGQGSHRPSEGSDEDLIESTKNETDQEDIMETPTRAVKYSVSYTKE